MPEFKPELGQLLTVASAKLFHSVGTISPRWAQCLVTSRWLCLVAIIYKVFRIVAYNKHSLSHLYHSHLGYSKQLFTISNFLHVI